MRTLSAAQIEAVAIVTQMIQEEEELLERALLDGKATEADIDRKRLAKYEVSDLLHQRPRWLTPYERKEETRREAA